MSTEAAYQLTRPTTVVFRQGIHERLETLDAGAVLVAAASTGDAAGMIQARWNGVVVEVFSRDLEERGVKLKTAPKRAVAPNS